ncbi:ATP-binding protein [Thiorhodospira sibirica]|uniref:ATP-binding protein n=1 Tax=Thiorhodospira sibirica TaxID=154347 RepID=UPI0011129042|nr:AAA family ATPase [Thiorhodospira sibirica]
MSISLEMRPRWSWRFFVFWHTLRKQPGFRMVNVAMRDVYRLSLGDSHHELMLFTRLWQQMGHWPELRVWIDGREVTATEFQHIFGCLQQAVLAPSPQRYCQGEAPFIKPKAGTTWRDDPAFLLTGCRFLVADDPLAGHLEAKPWYDYGHMDGEGVYHIDHAALQQALQQHAREQCCDLCPLLDLKALNSRIQQLPAHIAPRDDPRWQYRFDAQQHPIGVLRSSPPPSWAGRTDMDSSVTAKVVDEAAAQTPPAPAPVEALIHPPAASPSAPRDTEWTEPSPFTPQTEQRIGYADVGGQREAIRLIREAVEVPLRFPDLIKRLGIRAPRGILLYGPPGCGKTLLAEAVAHEVDAAFFAVKGPEFLSALHGQSEKRLRDLFAQAAKQAPSILFFDEIDAFAFDRGRSSSSFEATLVAQFLALLDGFDRREQICVIATTNRLDVLDPALLRPGRFDHRIHIGLPERDDRLHILGLHTAKLPLYNDVALEWLADHTQGYTGADLAALCAKAGLMALYRALGEDMEAWIERDEAILEHISVRQADFHSALSEVRPSVSAAQAQDGLSL